MVRVLRRRERDQISARLRGTAGIAGGQFGAEWSLFHGHWRLCQFLIESGAGVNRAEEDTGERPLHAAVSKAGLPAYERVVRVLLANGADPNAAAKDGVETGAFMRDCRTKGETPLHRAAAFGSEETVQLLLDAGAKIDARMRMGICRWDGRAGILRPAGVLRKLCYGDFRVHARSANMEVNLLGKPHV